MTIAKIVATYRLTTPMFCAGADQKVAELRAASFKGALRFWYRAIALGEKKTVKEVQEAEDLLFGSTRTGQAKVLLTLDRLANTKVQAEGHRPLLGQSYLAGQGLTEYDKGLKSMKTTRPALSANATFEIRLLVRRATREQLDDICRALKALGLLGGLGSRARRGFGSITLQNLAEEVNEKRRDVWEAPNTMQQIEQELRQLLPRKKEGQNDLPPYTAFSSATRFVIIEGEPQENAETLLNRIGMAFMHYRSYGRKTANGYEVGQHAARQNFKSDHHMMWEVAEGNNRVETAPKRVVFGLPHNYHFQARKKIDLEIHGQDDSRRASPLVMHIHQAPGARPMAIIAFLPATFLPRESRPLFILRRDKDKKTTERTDVELPPNLWKPIEDFLNELMKGNGSNLCQKFPGATEVTP